MSVLQAYRHPVVTDWADVRTRRLRGARIVAGLEQTDVRDRARAIGLNRGLGVNRVSEIENGAEPTQIEIELLARFYHCHERYFTDPAFDPLTPAAHSEGGEPAAREAPSKRPPPLQANRGRNRQGEVG